VQLLHTEYAILTFPNQPHQKLVKLLELLCSQKLVAAKDNIWSYLVVKHIRKASRINT